MFLAYEVGVLFSSSVNGVDFVSRSVFSLVGTRRNYLILHAALAGGFLSYLLYLRRRRAFSVRELALPMLIESCVYALTLGTFIVFVMQNMLGFSEGLAVGGELALGKTGESIVISLGAGVHEELVFRLALMSGVAWALMRTGMTRGWAVSAALLASAVIFSLAHHVGPHGDPFGMGVFTYRTLAGAIFGLIFYYRSLAHAVYSHFLYDFYVLVVRS